MGQLSGVFPDGVYRRIVDEGTTERLREDLVYQSSGAASYRNNFRGVDSARAVAGGRM
jgi:hypothetical protein